MKKALFFPLQVSLCTFSCLSFSSNTYAQVVPDGTTNTTVNAENGNFTIEQGDRAGNNLFHSFDDFSVPTNGSAFFNNAMDVSNIFSRVTGGNISNIDGLIGANGTANLFLVNPAGIIFGEGASLAIGGSFYGSTADSILFGDGEFSAVNNLDAPILTIDAPIGLSFRDQPGDIAIQESNLNVLRGKNLSLLGGEISLSGSTLNASEGKVNLGAVSSSGTVTLDQDLDQDLDFNFGNISLGNISINNGSIANVSGAGGGDIIVNSRNLTLAETSIFNAGINSDNSTPETQGGNITVNVSETVSLESGSLFRNNVNTDSSGNTGDIIITAKNLFLNDNSNLSTATSGNGNAGNINLSIADSVVLDQTAGIRSQVLTNGAGQGGNIQINSNSVALDNNSLLLTDVIGQGNGGNIQVDSNLINLNNNSFLIADVKGKGNGGNINVITDNLTLSERSSFSTTTSGQGNGGNVDIQASDHIILENSRLLATVSPEGVGNAGNINITTNSLLLKQGIVNGQPSRLLTNTLGKGNAGDINVNAFSSISLENSSTFQTQVGRGGEGTGGNIEINTTNLSLTGDSRDVQASLLAGSVGISDAGDITVNASGDIIFNQFSSINNQVSEGIGDAGNIIINSNSLLLNRRSLIINGTGDSRNPSNENMDWMAA